MAVQEESVWAVGAAAAEVLGCRPGWCVWTSREMARMPDLRAGVVLGGLCPPALCPRGSWTDSHCTRRPCRSVGRGVARAAGASR